VRCTTNRTQLTSRWDKELFPDHVEFLKDLRDRKLKTTLNVHPADGVRSFEKPYEAMCKALGRDSSKGVPIPFECADKKFFEEYFKQLHHPLEDEGVDFWWIDWQQGPHSEVETVDPLWMLNHYHFIDSGRKDERRFTFSRYAGPGSHRYPVGFSGVSAFLLCNGNAETVSLTILGHNHLVGQSRVPTRIHSHS
jgi:alpha-glucosidase (family GH31 glycosyl hydrolase)